MKYTVDYEKNVFVLDENQKIWASVRPVTQRSTVYDMFVAPRAGGNHHLQLSRDELAGIYDMLVEALEDSTNG
jgi:hypothetical protein